MLRKALLDKLSDVAPALADNDLIPVLTHYWFTGTTLMAFNDQISISVPFKTEFVGAVPGSVLLSLMKSSKAKNVELEPTDTEVLIKASSSRIKLPLLDEEAFIFEFPESTKNVLKVEAYEFLQGIQNCMRSLGSDTSIPEQLGVTLITDKKELRMYATNNTTVSQSIIEMKGTAPFKKRVVLSGVFCQQLLRLMKGATTIKLEVLDDYALLHCSNGTELFGRLIETDQPMNFDGILDQHFSVKNEKQLVSMPTKLNGILERAVIITDSNVDQGFTKITVKDGKARFFSKSDRGQLTDTLQVEAHHPNVVLKVEPKLLKNGYGDFTHMLFTERCVVMTKNSMLYMVATIGE